MIEEVKEACRFLEQLGVSQPQVGVILGTGLGDPFIRQIEDPLIIPYKEIPHFPHGTIAFHTGNLIYGRIRGKNVLAMQGRFHYYEGYTMQQITFPVRVMKLLGTSWLLISNAAGSLNVKWQKGDLMVLDDHINLLPDNPLRGIDQSEWNNPYPDMSQPYARALNEKLLTIARKHDIVLRSGVYAAVAGPNLETRAEYRYLRLIGADAVGMSTVPEVIVANQMHLPCCAISVLTDNCDPDNLVPVSIREILEVAGSAVKPLSTLFFDLIGEL